MSRGRKIVQYIAVWMLAIFGLGGFYLKAEAASQQIARLEEAADLTVMFNFDQENVFRPAVPDTRRTPPEWNLQRESFGALTG